MSADEQDVIGLLRGYEPPPPRTIEVPVALLEKLTNDGTPLNQDEQGGCVWCAGTPPREQYGYAGRRLIDHMSDCPWVIARQLIGDPIPER